MFIFFCDRFNGLHWFCVKNLCTKCCCKSLNKQSSGVQERINPFYINSYGENSFGLRTTFRNELNSWTEDSVYLKRYYKMIVKFATWFDRICRFGHLTTKYIQIKTNYTICIKICNQQQIILNITPWGWQMSRRMWEQINSKIRNVKNCAFVHVHNELAACKMGRARDSSRIFAIWQWHVIRREYSISTDGHVIRREYSISDSGTWSVENIRYLLTGARDSSRILDIYWQGHVIRREYSISDRGTWSVENIRYLLTGARDSSRIFDIYWQGHVIRQEYSISTDRRRSQTAGTGTTIFTQFYDFRVLR